MKMTRPMIHAALSLSVPLALACGPLRAETTHVAVAANFTEPAQVIAEAFAAATGHEALLSFGSTGQLYAQIVQAAPYEVFLAADAERPARALTEGLAVEGSAFTYAIGRLALWSAEDARPIGPDVLHAGDFQRLAMADPATAPYGVAAEETLESLGLLDTLGPKIVRGKNIAQTYQFVETGNAELGFVAHSQVVSQDTGSAWIVDPDLHSPIRQDAVLLATGKDSAAARAFLDFLQGTAARAIIERFGYESGEAPG